MSGEAFTLDTNVLVYAMDRRAGRRHTLAKAIVRAAAALADCWLTLQSVSEFYDAATRKGIVPAPEAQAQAQDWLDLFRTASASASAVRAALTMAAAGRASYWDALLVVTAAEAGCTAILTEDLADGTVLHGVRVINPFAGEELSPAARLLLSAEAPPDAS